MEQNPHPAVIISDAATTDSPDQPPKPTPRRRHNKLRGPMDIIRVALFMMRRRSSKLNTLPVNDGSRSIWRKLLGSMRPLHLQSNRSPLGPLQPGPPLPLIKVSLPSENTNHTEDALSSASESPAVASHCYSPSPPSSRYASAIALNELDQPEEDPLPQEEAIEKEEGDDNYKDREGDAMIDAKAEEFIAQFYHYHSPSSPSSCRLNELDQPKDFIAKFSHHSPSSPSNRLNELDQPEEFIAQFFYHSPSSPSSSRYASAVALNELDQARENPQEEAIKDEEEGDDNYKDTEGDRMIDAKAEEFIAQFYHQMKLQCLDDIDRRYRAMSMRSLR